MICRNTHTTAEKFMADFNITAQLKLKGPSKADIDAARQRIEKGLAGIHAKIATETAIKATKQGAPLPSPTEFAAALDKPLPRRHETPRQRPDQPTPPVREPARIATIHAAEILIKEQRQIALPSHRPNAQLKPEPQRIREIAHATQAAQLIRPASQGRPEPVTPEVQPRQRQATFEPREIPAQLRDTNGERMNPTTAIRRERIASRPPPPIPTPIAQPRRDPRPIRAIRSDQPKRTAPTTETARQANEQSANLDRMITSMARFDASSTRLAFGLNKFVGIAPPLTNALNQFPRTVTHTGEFTTQVIIAGAEMLSTIQPGIAAIVTTEINRSLARFAQRHLPDAGISADNV